MRRDQLSVAFFVFLMFMVFGGKVSAILPLVIIYFVIRSMMGNTDNRRGRDTRRYDERSRRAADQERRRYQEQRRYDEEQARRRRAEQMREDYNRRRRTAERERATRRTTPRVKKNPYKKTGVTKFNDYDYDGAIEDFKKALEIDASDISVHFNLACCYSLNEDKDNAFYHLSKAVALGYTDTKKIMEHDALAYLRIQDEFEAFKNNGFRIVESSNKTETKKENSNLIEQLKRLQELRERGVLTEQEFVKQKEKLLG